MVDNKKEIQNANSEVKIDSKEESAKQEKTLKRVFLVFGIIIALFLVIFFVGQSARHFNYGGLTGNVIKEGNIIFYQTSLPVNYQGKTVPYNFYLRNNPEKLKDIPFNGDVIFLKDVVINASEKLNCNGDGIIAVANLVKLYDVLGAKVIKDQNASCDMLGNYIFLQLEEGNETRIDKIGKSCYTLKVKDCEVLKATERLMVETIIEAKKNV
jgi:hypothetical protein